MYEEEYDEPIEVEFLTFEDVCEIQLKGLKDYGFGEPGFLDEHAVRSAIGQPGQGLFGEYLHDFPGGMAAAYLYYLAKQQGFINGNKRAAVAGCIEFLARNGYRLNATSLEVYNVTVNIAGEDVKIPSEKARAMLQKWIEERLLPME